MTYIAILSATQAEGNHIKANLDEMWFDLATMQVVTPSTDLTGLRFHGTMDLHNYTFTQASSFWILNYRKHCI